MPAHRHQAAAVARANREMFMFVTLQSMEAVKAAGWRKSAPRQVGWAASFLAIGESLTGGERRHADIQHPCYRIIRLAWCIGFTRAKPQKALLTRLAKRL